MANPHFEIKITKRSKRQSAVAGAAYQSGENLFSEYDQKHKDYRKKEGVVYTEIMLPSHAPPEYADREQLWNAVEAVENQWNSQLARRFVLALPREVPEELYPQMVQDYCNQFFVSKGMIVDFAIHDPKPPGHNPHCHVMLTMRAMDGHGKWLPKARKVYDLDENGERIRLPSGNWKSHKEDTVDWNEQYHGQEWRTGWETVQNRYLEMVNSPVRVDLRSYEKQGLDIIPTVHMGAAVTQMERRGIQTNIGNLNRDIKAANRMMSVIRSTIQNLRDWISDILEARKELLAEKKPETASPDLINLLRDYLNLRKAERRDWSRYEVTVKDTRGPPDCGPGPAGLDLLRPALLHRLYLRPRGNPCGGSGRSGARHLLGSKRHHSPGNCVPCLSHGSAYGGGVAAGKAPGPALYHSGLDLRISQTKTAPTLKKRRGCSYMCQESPMV